MEVIKPAELSLYRRILTWNYYDMWNKMEQKESFGFPGTEREVPLTFEGAEEYIAAFEPLMLGEFAAVMLTGIEETELVAPEKCITGPTEEVDGFLVVQFLLERPHARLFRHNDLILLTTQKPNDQISNEALNAMGMMETPMNENSLRIRFFLNSEGLPTQPEDAKRLQGVDARLRTASNGWWLTRITALSTSIREWNALHSIREVKLKDVLFSAKPTRRPSQLPLRIPEALEDAMAAQYNTSQMKALSAGLDGQQMVLVQGPPGTGKTNTLLGLLSAILYALPEGSMGLKTIRQTQTQKLSEAEKTRIWLESLLKPNPRDLVKPWEKGSYHDDFGMAAVEPIYKVGSANKPTAHVLVCAPSNSALDEIVLRLLGGILDRKGRRWQPNIVRLGLSVHHSVQSIAIDTLVEQRLARLAPIKNKGEREKLRMEIIEGAHIVCATLSFSGSSQLKQLSKPFDVVVIDEAAQAVEPSTLIPLTMGAKQVFLIGDPVQLPATVISREAISYKYDMSMFKRLQTAGYPVIVLDTQYRMHPSISAYPSSEFYHENLLDGPNVAAVTARPWHAHKFLGPFAFFDVPGVEKITGSTGSSLHNITEVELTLALYLGMLNAFPELRAPGSFAIISPYLAQVKLMKQVFADAMDAESFKNLDINTIDGFQGREKEVVIFSAVRSVRSGHVGFVADERRINVGLTRARCSLLVVGNAAALGLSSRWRNLLCHAYETRSFYKPMAPYNEFFDRAMAGRVAPEKNNPLSPKTTRKKAKRSSRMQQIEDGGIYSDEDFAPIINAAVQSPEAQPQPAEKRRAEQLSGPSKRAKAD